MKSNHKVTLTIPKFCNPRFCRSNLSLCIFLLLYFIIQIGLVIDRIFKYNKEHASVIVARSGGILLSFNMSLIILLIAKRCFTWLSNIVIFRAILPIDDFQKIHKFIGIYVVFLSLMHTIAHCVNQCKFQNIIF